MLTPTHAVTGNGVTVCHTRASMADTTRASETQQTATVSATGRPNVYKTASVEVLEGTHSHTCETELECLAPAKYNVFDGVFPIYACGRHLSVAIERTATRKGGA